VLKTVAALSASTVTRTRGVTTEDGANLVPTKDLNVAETTLLAVHRVNTNSLTLALTYVVAVDLMTVAVVVKNAAVRADVAFHEAVTAAKTLPVKTEVCTLRASAVSLNLADTAEV
jgi:hypothetical protein